MGAGQHGMEPVVPPFSDVGTPRQPSLDRASKDIPDTASAQRNFVGRSAVAARLFKFCFATCTVVSACWTSWVCWGIGEVSCLSTVVILSLYVWVLCRQHFQKEVPSRDLSRVNRYPLRTGFSLLVTALLASWNELEIGSHIAMIVSRVSRLIYH